jgi:hypothetical protein
MKQNPTPLMGLKPTVKRWVPPKIQYTKINVDAAVQKSNFWSSGCHLQRYRWEVFRRVGCGGQTCMHVYQRDRMHAYRKYMTSRMTSSY